MKNLIGVFTSIMNDKDKFDQFFGVMYEIKEMLEKRISSDTINYVHAKNADISDLPCGHQDAYGDELKEQSQFIDMALAICKAINADIDASIKYYNRENPVSLLPPAVCGFKYGTNDSKWDSKEADRYNNTVSMHLNISRDPKKMLLTDIEWVRRYFVQGDDVRMNQEEAFATLLAVENFLDKRSVDVINWTNEFDDEDREEAEARGNNPDII